MLIEMMMMALLGIFLAVNQSETKVPTELVKDNMNPQEILFAEANKYLNRHPWLGPGNRLYSNEDRERLIRTTQARENSFLKHNLSGFRGHRTAMALFNWLFEIEKEPSFWNTGEFIEAIATSLFFHKRTHDTITRQVWETLKPESKSQYFQPSSVKFPPAKPRPCPNCKVYVHKSKESSSTITMAEYETLPRGEKKFYEDATEHSRNGASTTIECKGCGEIIGCFSKFENPIAWKHFGPKMTAKFHVNTAVGILLSDAPDGEWESTFIAKIRNGAETMEIARRIVEGIKKSIEGTDAPTHGPGGAGIANVDAFEVEGE
jgi:hypothetical protein